MTTPPFFGRTGEWTDAELAADIALCRKVLNDGSVNGYVLDGNVEIEWRDWLHDFEVEAAAREEAKASVEAPVFSDAQIDAAQERMARLLGLTEADLETI